MQDSITQFGRLASTSNKSKIYVEEAIDHLDVPSYPKTSEKGVAHFIHLKSPLNVERKSKKEVAEIMTRFMSKVS